MPEGQGGRLIVVSNRIPKGDVPAGGLVFALHEALSEAGGIWVGAADPTERADAGLAPLPDPGGLTPYDRMTFALTPQEQAGYYGGYANSVLWPLCHHRVDLLRLRAGDFEAYAAVNRRVARGLAAMLRPDDTVWIHDYHFLMVADELRRLGVGNRIGFFLHIPFPNATDIRALPQWEKVPEWLAAHDLVGVQTTRDVTAVLELLRADVPSQLLNDGSLVRDGRVFQVRSFPIGIDARGFAQTAAEADVPDLLLRHGAPLVIGVDRLDYSKGLVHRFEAYGRYLAKRDPDTRRPTFLQIAPPSREDVAAYMDIREELEGAAGRLNGALADLDWTPIRYIRRHLDRARIAALYRRADVAMVTPLADGMNLVAKEFVAAQDADDPGVLILSHFAGAAETMDAALLINPFDTEGFADTIARALTMPLAERRERHAALTKDVFERDVAWWTRTFLGRLAKASPSYESYLKGR
jgi:trehalose 6-phosphate synthase